MYGYGEQSNCQIRQYWWEQRVRMATLYLEETSILVWRDDRTEGSQLSWFEFAKGQIFMYDLSTSKGTFQIDAIGLTPMKNIKGNS